MERSNSSSVRSTIEDHIASNLSEEQVRDDTIVARSGDPGMVDEDGDPWSTGEVEQLERKVLQKELMDRISRGTDADICGRTSFRRTSLERSASLSSARFSRVRSYQSQQSCRNSIDDASFMPIEHDLQAMIESSVVITQPTDSALARDSLETSVSATSVLYIQQKHSNQKVEETFWHWLDYFNTLAHLACFGIIGVIGVLIRYGLQELFSSVLFVTHDKTIVYRELPANVLGSFFMGWVGIIMKKNIIEFSEPLAIGLSTGLMGSITTYAGWNQKMVELLSGGKVVAAFSGLLLGMAIAQMSLLAGVDSAKSLKNMMDRYNGKTNKTFKDGFKDDPKRELDHKHYHATLSFTIFAIISICLWGISLALVIKNGSSQKLHILYFSCIVAPPGVWARWHLARFNGKGIRRHFKWLPVGTLMANLVAAMLEAVTSVLLFVVSNKSSSFLVGGIQLGFIGCLSTVSTFVAEVYTMCVGGMKLKAYAYTFITLILGLILGVILYAIPSWSKGYVKW